MLEQICVDAGDSGYTPGETVASAEPLPFPGVEDELGWRDKFLECPTSGEPSAFGEGRCLGDRIFAAGNISEIYISYGRVSIPCEHGVDGLGEFGRARLVDTARIDLLHSENG